MWYRYVHEKEYLCNYVTNFLYPDRKQCILNFNVRKSYNFVENLGFNSKIIFTQSHILYILSWSAENASMCIMNSSHQNIILCKRKERGKTKKLFLKKSIEILNSVKEKEKNFS